MPLETACLQRNIGMVEILLRMGAHPNKGCPLRGNLTTSILSFDVLFSKTQQDTLSRLAVQELLLMYKADVNQQDDDPPHRYRWLFRRTCSIAHIDC